jgi:hypothetical protein
MKRLMTLLALFAVVGVLTVARPAMACPMCKEAVPAGSDGVMTPEEQEAVQQARAWNNSIYLFVSMPYLLVAGVSFLVYRGFRKAKLAQNAEPQTGPS